MTLTKERCRTWATINCGKNQTINNIFDILEENLLVTFKFSILEGILESGQNEMSFPLSLLSLTESDFKDVAIFFDATNTRNSQNIDREIDETINSIKHSIPFRKLEQLYSIKGCKPDLVANYG